jgi:predicted membrane-bound spermidine synthase
MRKFLLVIVFVSGLVSLAVEFAASRLLGNYFGTSNLVWASIVGLILIYLTLGYFLGGSWADRSPKYETLFKILAWAALTVGLIPIASRPILRLASQAFDQLALGALFGSFSVVMILFIIPVTLLGTASPFAIRLSIDDPQKAGKVSGRIYAISTLGSFIGTFLPVLVLVPTIGTYRTFLVLSLLLLVFALIGLYLVGKGHLLLRYLWMPVIIVALFIIGVRGGDKSTAGLVYETESSYNYIQVLEQDGYILLRLNEGQGIHSIYKKDQLNFNGPWEQVLSAPFFNTAPVKISDVNRIAIVGLAAGTTAREALAVFPNATVDGIEIDPKIIAVGEKYFGMNSPRLNVITQDGRWAISNSSNRYDIISVDAYRPPYIPWHMTTVEFFEALNEHLTPQGVVSINVGRAPEDRRLVDALYTTMKQVFPSVFITDLSGSFNTILFATKQPCTLDNFTANYLQLYTAEDTPQLVLEVMAATYDGLQESPALTTVFTDDLAPIEGITNSMVLKFLLSDEVENLE